MRRLVVAFLVYLRPGNVWRLPIRWELILYDSARRLTR